MVELIIASVTFVMLLGMTTLAVGWISPAENTRLAKFVNVIGVPLMV